MVLVKPTPVTSALSAWKEVQRSRFCALQKRTIVFATSWRIVTLAPEYVVAASDSAISIDADWDRVHALVEERFQSQYDAGASESDVTELLVSFIAEHTDAAALPVSLGASYGDGSAPWVVTPRAAGPVAMAPPPSLVLPPRTSAATATVAPTSQPQPPKVAAAPKAPAAAAPAPPKAPAVPAPAPVVPAPAPLPPAPASPAPAPAPASPAPAPAPASPAPAPKPTKPVEKEEDAASKPSAKPTPEKEEPAPVPSAAAAAAVAPSMRMLDVPSPRAEAAAPTSPRIEPASPVAAVAAEVLPPKPLSVPPKAPSKQSVRMTEEMISESKKWEERRFAFLDAMEPVWAEHRAQLEKLHQHYLEGIARVARATGFDDEQFLGHMHEEESRSLALASRGLFGRQCTCVNVLDEEINSRNMAFGLDQKAALIQRVFRGWICRVRFKRLAKSLYLREKAAREALTTERTYVENLELMVREYLVPLRAKACEPRAFITPETVATLFSNVEALIPVHKEFLAKLEERLAEWDNAKTPLSDIFNKLAPALKLYVQYVSSFDRSSNVLTALLENSDFRKWHEAVCHKPELKMLRLNAFLIMPVQRVPRYELLLRELVKNTAPAHPDHEGLKDAYEMIQKVAEDINEGKRDAEAREKVSEYQELLKDQITNLAQPHRRYIDECMAVRDRGEGLQSCFLLLFNDVMLVTQRKGKTILVLLDQLPLAGAEVVLLPDNASQQKWQFGLQVKCGVRAANFYMETKSVRDRWLEKASALTRTLTRSESSLSLTRMAMQEMGEIERQESILGSVFGGARKKEKHAKAPENPRVQDVISIYQEVVKLQAEILTMPIDLRTLFPMYYQKLHPDHIARLKTRINLLGDKLKIIDQLNQRALALLKSESIFHMLDKSITDGMDNISGMKSWVAAMFGRGSRAAVQQPQQQQQQSMMASAPPMRQMSMSAIPSSSQQQQQQQQQQRVAGDPQKLMSFILMWYINLCQTWELVTQTNL